ncbi:MAG: ATP phosphoribosyltransferase regulatory subunit [Thioploca sp.]|nr:ATP phosphoribosyltransferase regulatory subunit [Thioploca sp.]
MSYQDRWLLPAGIIDSLPEESAHLEKLRRRLLDVYATWGYELVIPPLMEYLESLLVGTGQILDLQTFKLTDQFTGRLMGIRADMTPQIARIDAHRLRREVPTRLCYLGTVLHTRPNSFSGSRSPLQVGVELFGYQGVDSDIEILSLMLETLEITGITDFHIDIGHVEIYRRLIAQAKREIKQTQQPIPTTIQTDREEENEEPLFEFEEPLFDAIKRKANTEIKTLLSQWNISQPLRQMLSELPQLHGDAQVLQAARRIFNRAPHGVHTALDELEQLQAQWHGIPLHFDLAELRGYSYHMGVIFAAYVSQHGRAIAKGGRYDIGKSFGCSRPATGFSTNLRTIVSLQPEILSTKPAAIFAPPTPTDALLATTLATTIRQLREQGEVVISRLPHQIGDAQAMGCDRELRLTATGWQVTPL